MMSLLGVIETIRLEHDHLVVALVVALVLGVVRNSALRGDLAGALGRVQLWLCSLVSVLLILRVAVGRLALIKAAHNARRAEIAALLQVLESPAWL